MLKETNVGEKLKCVITVPERPSGYIINHDSVYRSPELIEVNISIYAMGYFLIKLLTYLYFLFIFIYFRSQMT